MAGRTLAGVTPPSDDEMAARLADHDRALRAAGLDDDTRVALLVDHQRHLLYMVPDDPHEQASALVAAVDPAALEREVMGRVGRGLGDNVFTLALDVLAELLRGVR